VLEPDDTSRPPELDERWFGEWCAFGLAELGAYLERWARFDQFCRDRDAKRELEGG